MKGGKKMIREKKDDKWYSDIEREIISILAAEKCTISEAKEILAITARIIENSSVQISND